MGLVKERISLNSASLSAIARPNCLFIRLRFCFERNCDGSLSFQSDQSPSAARLFIRDNFCVPSASSYQLCPPCSFIAEPKGLFGSFLMFLRTVLSLGPRAGVPFFLLVLNITSTPSGISSEYTAMPFK